MFKAATSLSAGGTVVLQGARVFASAGCHTTYGEVEMVVTTSIMCNAGKISTSGMTPQPCDADRLLRILGVGQNLGRRRITWQPADATPPPYVDGTS